MAARWSWVCKAQTDMAMEAGVNGWIGCAAQCRSQGRFQRCASSEARVQTVRECPNRFNSGMARQLAMRGGQNLPLVTHSPLAAHYDCPYDSPQVVGARDCSGGAVTAGGPAQPGGCTGSKAGCQA